MRGRIEPRAPKSREVIESAAAMIRDGHRVDRGLARMLSNFGRQVVRGWDYDASVEAFVAAVRDAAHRA